MTIVITMHDLIGAQYMYHGDLMCIYIQHWANCFTSLIQSLQISLSVFQNDVCERKKRLCAQETRASTFRESSTFHGRTWPIGYTFLVKIQRMGTRSSPRFPQDIMGSGTIGSTSPSTGTACPKSLRFRDLLTGDHGIVYHVYTHPQVMYLWLHKYRL